MKTPKIINLIKRSKDIPVDKNWLREGRQTLHNFIIQNPVRKPELGRQILNKGFFNKLTLKPMPIVIIALIASLLTGGGVVAASQGSLPTDALYPVKIATEKAQEAVTFSRVKKIDLQARLAGKRLTEIERLQKKDGVDPAVIENILEKYENHLALAQSQLADLNLSEAAPKIIATAVKLENALERQREKLAVLGAQAPPAHQSLLNEAQVFVLANSNQVLKKMETEIQETETAAQANTATGVGKAEIKPSVIMEKVPAYVPGIEEKAKNRINAAENKIAEIRKKIDAFASQEENKCDPEEKQEYIKKLEQHYQKMTMALAEAKRLFDNKDYLNSLSQANYAFSLALGLDNMIGKWRRDCGVNEEVEMVTVGQKFEMKMGETVEVKNEKIQLTLKRIFSECPPCPEGQVCAMFCPASSADLTIIFPSQLRKEFNLSLGKNQKIGDTLYFELLEISGSQITAIINKNNNKPNEKKVSLNQEFDLTIGQTATLADYNNLRIKINDVAISSPMCVQGTPCPSTITVSFVASIDQCINEQAVSTRVNSNNNDVPVSSVVKKCGGSNTSFYLNVGQSKMIFGVKITLLNFDNNTATLIMTKGTTGCSIPKCLNAYQTGEYDDNNCPIYRCGGPQTCSVFVTCKDGEETYFSGDYDSNGCPIYQCRENNEEPDDFDDNVTNPTGRTGVFAPMMEAITNVLEKINLR
ncbi:MAG: DUF5667 domain-containing protein [Patescibacteria group bacterium]